MRTRRRVAILATVGTFAALSAPTASAEQACPVHASGWQLYPIVGDIGDPAPAPGEEPLWDTFVAAVAAEGLTVESLAEQLGFADVDELYSFVLVEFVSVDANANRHVCVKPFPEPSQGFPVGPQLHR